MCVEYQGIKAWETEYLSVSVFNNRCQSFVEKDKKELDNKEIIFNYLCMLFLNDWFKLNRSMDNNFPKRSARCTVCNSLHLLFKMPSSWNGEGNRADQHNFLTTIGAFPFDVVISIKFHKRKGKKTEEEEEEEEEKKKVVMVTKVFFVQ
jgi:hypothetical protein